MLKQTIQVLTLSAALAGSVAFADDGVWNQIEGGWDELKGSVQETWGELTGDEIDQLVGKRDQLVGSIKQKYGIAQEEAEAQVDDWAESLGLDG